MSISETVTQATSLVDGARVLVDAPWGRLEAGEVVAAVEAVATARTLLDGCLVQATDRLIATDAVHGLGWASVKDYLTHVTGGHQGSGGGLVRAVEQLRELPQVQAALEAGAVSLPQARAIATQVQKLPRQAPGFRAEVAARLLDAVVAGGHGASAVQGRLFDEVVRRVDPDGVVVDVEKGREKAERGVHASRFLSLSTDKVGGVRVKGYGTPEDVEKIKAALFPLAAPVSTEPGECGGVNRRAGQELFDAEGNAIQRPCLDPVCGHDGRDPREHGTGLWDALVEACDRLVATETLPRDHGMSARVIVTIDHASLSRQLIEAGVARAGQSPTGATLSAHAVRRLACDAEIIPAVLGAEGEVLDVGRARRLVTPAIWTALIARDGHCAFPTCTRPPLACDAHHVEHWADGGATSVDNMVMLCRRHHTIVHHTPWVVEIDPDTRLPLWRPPPRLRVADLQGKVAYHRARSPGSGRGRDPSRAA